MVKVVKCRYCGRIIKIYKDTQVFFRCCGIQQTIADKLVDEYSWEKVRKRKKTEHQTGDEKIEVEFV